MIKTLEITNFQGRLTRYNDGDINSGYAKYSSTFGNDPITSPSNLTWFENPTRIDPDEDVITDLIMAARPRLESGITYVYAIGHTGRLYKIQVNDPTTYNPDYDNPVLLATLTAESPTFKYGASIQFFGDTERLYIGHDRGVTRVNFDGASETFVGTQASYTSDVPRPSVQFLGKLYFGNGANLVEIDSTATVTDYSKLDPAFPVGTQVRDIDVSPDGNYVQIVVSRVAQSDMTVATQDTSSLSSADSYFIFWNGTDTGYTSYNPYNSYSINSNTSFGPFSYTTGYDLGGAAIYTQGQKILSLPDSQTPSFNAMFSTGNLVGFVSPEQNDSVLKGSLLLYGSYDKEIAEGLYRWFRLSATTQTDIQQVPVCVIVSNLFYGASSAGYTDNKVGSAKIYFSTLETDSAPTTKYKLYKFTTVPTGVGTAIAGVYETQTQLFSKKITIKEVRVYGESWVTNNAFTVALIGSNGTPIANSSKTFTAGTDLTVGDDFAWYNHDIAPTYALGLRITNSGSVNNVITKVEVDFEVKGGK
ncbi:MAG: hypothetical protein A3F67_04795 [Verrucomicrobia bacterium RIFCSPHIGHO2_12_FULL_41_10]|nr:MAG: hypothetical protein A3F67_04795 [Verrucomicrobia bacterium RIFCSPHIGHO2_12_FULL_41_10]